MEYIGYLRPLIDADLELVLSWRNSPSVRKNMYTRHRITYEEHQRWWASVKENASHQYLIYEFKEKSRGVVSFNSLDNDNRHAFWAFYADPEAPRGTGMLMEFLALDRAFTSLGLNKLSCEVLDFNFPVIKMHRKFGFVEEGIFRSHHRVGESFRNVYRLGILKNEWQICRDSLLKKVKRFVPK